MEQLPCTLLTGTLGKSNDSIRNNIPTEGSSKAKDLHFFLFFSFFFPKAKDD